MKKLIYILALGVFPLAFSSCGASKIHEEKEFQTKPPFKVVKATYNSWVGGQPGVRGIRVEISIDNSEITLDTIYFRNMETTLKKELNSANELYVGTFVLPKKNEFILHSDPKKEYGNEVPDISLKIPFVLKKDEAIVSYSYKNKRVFFKVEHLIETKSASINN